MQKLEDKEVHAFSKGFSPNVNIIGLQKFKLVCYNAVVDVPVVLWLSS